MRAFVCVCVQGGVRRRGALQPPAQWWAQPWVDGPQHTPVCTRPSINRAATATVDATPRAHTPMLAMRMRMLAMHTCEVGRVLLLLLLRAAAARKLLAAPAPYSCWCCRCCCLCGQLPQPHVQHTRLVHVHAARPRPASAHTHTHTHTQPARRAGTGAAAQPSCEQQTITHAVHHTSPSPLTLLADAVHDGHCSHSAAHRVNSAPRHSRWKSEVRCASLL
jgi:hypothetical protein